MTAPSHPILIYTDAKGQSRLDVRLDGNTLWLSQKQLTELFGKAKGTISEHIAHIFEDSELEPQATVRLFRTVQTEGNREVERAVEHYNLDMILAVGYRVRSPVGVRFRQWASGVLKSYIETGVAMDDERLNKPVLQGAGSVSHEAMLEFVHNAYETYDQTRKQQEAIEADAQDLHELRLLETEIKNTQTKGHQP